MSEAVANGHLSIGEVLALVQEDFPDVTISKIRFLESQGLIAPERTASGYRKFYEADIERLRWILAQQRDHFLPLKVIKKMLDQGVDVADPSRVQPSLFSSPEDEPVPPIAPSPSSTPRSAAHPAVKSAPAARRSVATTVATADRVDPGPAGSREDASAKRHSTPADVVAALQEDPRSTAPARRGGQDGPPPADPGAGATAAVATRSGALGADASGEVMTAEELCVSCGVTQDLIDDLESYGLLVPAMLGGVRTYDAEAQLVARAAARCVELGVEPRHLRMYKVAAEREAGLFEQLITPLLKQRRPSARQEAVEMLEDLAELADDLRAAMVRAALRDYLGRA